MLPIHVAVRHFSRVDSTDLLPFRDFDKPTTIPDTWGKRYAFEFWEQRNRGEVSDTLSLCVPAHASKVVWLEDNPRTSAETLTPVRT